MEVPFFTELKHENLIKFYSWYETRNHLWLIFEYCSGGNLFELIDAETKLPESTVKELSFQLVEALNFLHSKGTIYADLKPANVLLNEYH
jgi:serine/threonine-protein kinase ULK4